MSEDARRAIRDSRPSYAADSIRGLLRMAADRDTAKVGMIQRIYLSRRVPSAPGLVEVLDHVGHLADALGRDDDEREALAAAFRNVDVRQDGAWLRLADAWLKHIGVEVDGPRHLCTACWTEGVGSAPRACPKCGSVGAWFITATHGGRPLKELLTGLFADYQLPPEMEDVLVKPSERPTPTMKGEHDMVDNHEEGHDLGVDMRTFGLGRDLMFWLEDQGRPTEGVRVLDSVYLLSAGDASEYGMVLYRDTDGQVHVWTAWQYRDPWSTEHALEVLEQRADLYERRAAESRAFAARARLALAKGED